VAAVIAPDHGSVCVLEAATPPAAGNTLRVRDLGRQPYEAVWRAMQRFTDERDEHTPDELWLVEHERVFTLGQAGKPEHVLAAGDIPVLPVDRGGQVTYHGPGQRVRCSTCAACASACASWSAASSRP
jgi:lipoyl(octanoyl) transferase